MNEELIEKALETSCFDWHSINRLIDQATDAATRQRLISIQRRKYHEEEYRA